MNKKQLYESIMQGITENFNHALNEGTWGTEPNESDYYWDDTWKYTKEIKKMWLDGLKKFGGHEPYKTMGMINGFLHAENIWDESIHSENYDIKLWEAYEKAFNYLNDDNENREGWKHFDKFKKSLRQTYNEFKKLMKDKYHFDYEKSKKEIEDRKKHPEKYEPTLADESETNFKVNENFNNFNDLGFEPFHLPVYDYVDWELPENYFDECLGTTRDLVNGIHYAKYTGHTFMLENGDKYYSPITVKNIAQYEPFKDYCVYNGQIKEYTENDIF